MREKQRSKEARRKCAVRRKSNLSDDSLDYSKPNRRSLLDRRSEKDRRMGNY